jgi:siroheme synthase
MGPNPSPSGMISLTVSAPSDSARVALMVDGRVIPSLYHAATHTIMALASLPEGNWDVQYRYEDRAGNVSLASPSAAVKIVSPQNQLDLQELDGDGIVFSDEKVLRDLNTDGIDDADQRNVATLRMTSGQNVAIDATVQSPTFSKLLDDPGFNQGGYLKVEIQIDGIQNRAATTSELLSASLRGTQTLVNVSDVLEFRLYPQIIRTGLVDESQVDLLAAEVISQYVGQIHRIDLRLAEGQYNTYFKVSAAAQGVWAFSWDNVSGTGAVFSDSNGDGQTDTVSLFIRDGGRGDDDGMADGVIVDPGFVAMSAALPEISLDLSSFTADRVLNAQEVTTAVIRGTSSSVGSGRTVSLTLTDRTQHSITAVTTTDSQGNWSFPGLSWNSLADGAVQVALEVTNLYGATATSSDAFDLDRSPPTAVLTLQNFNDSGASNTDRLTQDRNFSLSADNVEAGAATAFEVSTDNGLSWSATVAQQSNLPDGSYLFRAIVTDAAGNSATSSSRSVVVDTQSPAAANLVFIDLQDSGASNTDRLTQDRNFSLSADNVEAGAATSFEVSTDNGINWLATSAQQSNLPDGRYLFRIATTDLAGNIGFSATSGVVVMSANPPPTEKMADIWADQQQAFLIDDRHDFENYFSAFGLDATSLNHTDPRWTSLKGELPQPVPSVLRPDTQWQHKLNGLREWAPQASTTRDWMEAGQDDWGTAQPKTDGGASEGPTTSADGFQVLVNPLNPARLVVLRGQPDQTIVAGQKSLILIAPDVFAHAHAEAQVNLTLTLANGQAAPTWVSMNSQTGQMRVDPSRDAPDQLVLRLTAQDQDGANASTEFALNIQKNKPAPTGRMSFSDKLRQASSVTHATTSPHLGPILRHG